MRRLHGAFWIRGNRGAEAIRSPWKMLRPALLGVRTEGPMAPDIRSALSARPNSVSQHVAQKLQALSRT